MWSAEEKTSTNKTISTSLITTSEIIWREQIGFGFIPRIMSKNTDRFDVYLERLFSKLKKWWKPKKLFPVILATLRICGTVLP